MELILFGLLALLSTVSTNRLQNDEFIGVNMKKTKKLDHFRIPERSKVLVLSDEMFDVIRKLPSFMHLKRTNVDETVGKLKAPSIVSGLRIVSKDLKHGFHAMSFHEYKEQRTKQDVSKFGWRQRKTHKKNPRKHVIINGPKDRIKNMNEVPKHHHHHHHYKKRHHHKIHHHKKRHRHPHHHHHHHRVRHRHRRNQHHNKRHRITSKLHHPHHHHHHRKHHQSHHSRRQSLKRRRREDQTTTAYYKRQYISSIPKNVKKRGVNFSIRPKTHNRKRHHLHSRRKHRRHSRKDRRHFDAEQKRKLHRRLSMRRLKREIRRESIRYKRHIPTTKQVNDATKRKNQIKKPVIGRHRRTLPRHHLRTKSTIRRKKHYIIKRDVLDKTKLNKKGQKIHKRIVRLKIRKIPKTKKSKKHSTIHKNHRNASKKRKIVVLPKSKSIVLKNTYKMKNLPIDKREVRIGRKIRRKYKHTITSRANNNFLNFKTLYDTKKGTHFIEKREVTKDKYHHPFLILPKNFSKRKSALNHHISQNKKSKKHGRRQRIVTNRKKLLKNNRGHKKSFIVIPSWKHFSHLLHSYKQTAKI